MPQFFDCSGGSLAELGFELGEDLFDWVEVRTVGRQVVKVRALRFDGLADALDLVGGQIIHDDDVAGFQGGNKELLRPGPESLAIHGPIQRHGSGEAVVAKGCEERGCAPMAVRCFHQQPVTDGTAATAAHHVGCKAGLVDEGETVDVEGGLLFHPIFTRCLDVRPVLLGGVKSFF